VFLRRGGSPRKGGWFCGRLLMMTARFFGLKTGGCRCRRSGATGSTRHKAGYMVIHSPFCTKHGVPFLDSRKKKRWVLSTCICLHAAPLRLAHIRSALSGGGLDESEQASPCRKCVAKRVIIQSIPSRRSWMVGDPPPSPAVNSTPPQQRR
jgi:hypothetical protein